MRIVRDALVYLRLNTRSYVRHGSPCMLPKEDGHGRPEVVDKNLVLVYKTKNLYLTMTAYLRSLTT